jgi:nitroreductase
LIENGDTKVPAQQRGVANLDGAWIWATPQLDSRLRSPQRIGMNATSSSPPIEVPPLTLIPYRPHVPAATPEQITREFHRIMAQRRTVRHFSDRPVSREVIENLVRVAGTAPSGANKQPWRFVAVQNPALKRQIRAGAEKEEHAFSTERANPQWLADLRAAGNEEIKPFLEEAPWLIVVFKVMRDENPRNPSTQVYYVTESAGIAVGMLLAAAQHAGLSTLVHTPSPMKTLATILGRPEFERPFLLISIGYAAEQCQVPDLQRKALDEIMVVDR